VTGDSLDKSAAMTGLSKPIAQRALKVESGNIFSRTEATIPSSVSDSIDCSVTKRKQASQNITSQGETQYLP
jgi:hypothetical protein